MWGGIINKDDGAPLPLLSMPVLKMLESGYETLVLAKHKKEEMWIL
jgi:hypothetical protein